MQAMHHAGKTIMVKDDAGRKIFECTEYGDEWTPIYNENGQYDRYGMKYNCLKLPGIGGGLNGFNIGIKVRGQTDGQAGLRLLNKAIKYAKPTLTSIKFGGTPCAQCTGSAGDTLTVTGTNFPATNATRSAWERGMGKKPGEGFQIRLGSSQPCASSIIINSTRAICRVPAGQGTNLSVSVSVGGHDSPESGYVFNYKPPEIITISPSSGPSYGGELITISGTGFGAKTEPMRVTFASKINASHKPECVIREKSDTKIICTQPVSMSGDAPVPFEVFMVAGGAGGQSSAVKNFTSRACVCDK